MKSMKPSAGPVVGRTAQERGKQRNEGTVGAGLGQVGVRPNRVPGLGSGSFQMFERIVPVDDDGCCSEGLEATGPRAPQVPTELDRNEKMVFALADAVSVLEQKLSPIVIPMPPAIKEKCGVDPTDGEAACLIAARVADSNRRLAEIINRISVLTSAVEL